MVLSFHLAGVTRLLVRLLMIKVDALEEEPGMESTTRWAKRFGKFLNVLPKTVGEIIRIGQWLHSTEGRKFLAECTQIAVSEFGDSSNASRLCQSWGCAIFAARKVDSLVFRGQNQRNSYIMKNY